MTIPEATPVLLTDLPIWVRHLTIGLARFERPPTCVEARVGDGLHLLLHGAGTRPLHLRVSLAPNAAGGPPRAGIRTIRSVALAPLSELERQWLSTLRRGLERVEKRQGWRSFLERACASGSAAPDLVGAEGPRLTSGDATLLRITRRCQAHCEFCNALGVLPDLAVDRASFEKRVALAAAAGRESITLTGGEPTLRPDLPDLIRWIRAAGIPRVDLQTNGLWLHRRDRVQRLAEAGLTSIFLSLHSARPEIHDDMLGLRGAHRRALSAAEHCREVGVLVCVNCVVARPNLDELTPLVSLLSTQVGRVGLRLSFVSPTADGPALPAFTPRLSEAAPRMAEAIDIGRALGLDVRIPGLCGIPMCLLPEHGHCFDELHESAPPPRLVTRAYVPSCGTCPVRARCSGFWRAYIAQFGEEELGWPARCPPPSPEELRRP